MSRLGRVVAWKKEPASCKLLLKAGNAIAMILNMSWASEALLFQGHIQQVCAHIKPENIDYDIEHFLDSAKSKVGLSCLVPKRSWRSNLCCNRNDYGTLAYKKTSSHETHHSEGLGLVDWQNPMLEGMKKKYREMFEWKLEFSKFSFSLPTNWI